MKFVTDIFMCFGDMYTSDSRYEDDDDDNSDDGCYYYDDDN